MRSGSLLKAAVAATAATGLLAGPLTGPAAAAAPAGQTTAPTVAVIVRHDGSGAAEAAVTRAGGTIGQHLDLVGAFTAQLPAGALAAVSRAPGVRAVTPDGQVRMRGEEWNADEDQHSMSSLTQSIGAQQVWATTDASGAELTGQGVGVAVIDSGIAPVEGLDAPGKVINGPDLSFESQTPALRNLDTFGHGTHMAGIIAGHDSRVQAGKKQFTGVAPDAHLLNMKVAAADGAVDVSQVIAAIDWVVTHRDDPGLNIRVLNLSFGTDSTQDPRLDPLSFAVEAAWKKGIVVVVSVGNDGLAESRVGMPAANPNVLAVGAADPLSTADRSDDVVADFSTGGSQTRHADLVAPGKSVVSLRVPNGFIDAAYPEARIADDPAQRYFRGSGTSQAAAVVSGAAALLLQQRPDLTPDQVKKLLTGTADAMPAGDQLAQGAGQLDIAAAVQAPTPVASTQTYLPATGLGSLEASRGTSHVADPDTGTELTGEFDIMGQAWTPAGWAQVCTTGAAWSGDTWNGRTWSGRTWSGSNWAGRTWSGRTWSGAVWDGRTWSGRTWSGRTWSGRTWSGRTWSGQAWSASDWG
ncbi:S8 family serine peptidase [Dactylosporangium sp. NPDC005555]|uniref:S8 family serine peptidase n=1 Tax=Dactylosporangium sp. NPDC005555 TaxID=3154889 RepID=UPI0033BBBD51